MKFILAAISTLLLMPSIASAQIETGQSQKSLENIRGFYVQVVVEGSVGLTSDEKLNVKAINQGIKQRLRDAGLNVLEPTEGIDQSTEPYLYLHLNMIEMEQGLVPFAVNMQFFQRVELPRARRSQSMIACTWDSGFVGLVSYDNLDMISDAAVESVDEFIDDFRIGNP